MINYIERFIRRFDETFGVPVSVGIDTDTWKALEDHVTLASGEGELENEFHENMIKELLAVTGLDRYIECFTNSSYGLSVGPKRGWTNVFPSTPSQQWTDGKDWITFSFVRETMKGCA